MRNLVSLSAAAALATAMAWSIGSSGLLADEPLLIPRHAEWKYFAGRAVVPAGWSQPAFDDRGWRSGRTGIGYGDNDDWTVLTEMQNGHQSVYLRQTFDLEGVDPIESLYLYLRFDDGFVAYLNGTQVAARGVSGQAPRLRVDLHEADRFEEFVIEKAASLLEPGANVLAIEGHNASTDSSDFSLDPVLSPFRLESVEEAIPADDCRRDLDELRRRLEDQSSYLTHRGFDYDTALSEFRATIDEEMQFSDFVAGIRKIVMRIGDCHAGVAAVGWPASRSALPLRPADTGQGVAALGISLDEPIDSDCPYLESIDGVSLERWMAAAAQYVPSGSPQLIRRSSLDWLGLVDLLRSELGLPARETVVVGLRSADGTRQLEQSLRLTRQSYGVVKVPLGPTRQLDGDIGYIRIPLMTSRVARSTVNEIKRFRDAAGMILDVRGNGGGTQEVLLAVYGFFVPNDAEPYVNNIAAYRLSDQFQQDHIAYRPTFRASWPGWSDREREAIQAAAGRFAPEWRPPEDKFSQWHYLLLSRRRSGRSADDFFHYDRPVVVLCNAGSFSATDGFLSAFADLPRVTIVGEPSGGGSGAKRPFRLPNTQLRVTLSSMASFRAGGKLFEGNGVEVDVEARPRLADFLGDSDSVLQRGVETLRSQF